MRLLSWACSRRRRELSRSRSPRLRSADFESTYESPKRTDMKAEKRKKLESAGWRVGDTQEFLGLSQSEAEFVEIKLALARKIRQFREKHHWTQAEFAKRVGSSQ